MSNGAATARKCGTCSQCCKILGIEGLDKAIGEWCRHRKPGVGCGIYGAHPPACQTFACQWLREPDLPHRYRPDQTKVVLASDHDGYRLVAHCDPANPWAWRREPIRSLLRERARARWGSGAVVMAKVDRRLWVITPDGEVDIGEIDPRAPMKFDQRPDGSVGVEILPAIPEGEDLQSGLVRRLGTGPGA
jgi:hypothetical protein